MTLKSRVASVAAAGLMAGLFGSAIAETRLSGDSLKQAVAGKTVVMNTAVGGVPVVFRADGSMRGKSMQVGMYTGQASDTGRWWIKSDKLCQQWKTWLDGTAQCVTVRLEGKTVHWRRDDGKTGTATLVSN